MSVTTTTCERCNGEGKEATTEMYRGRRVDIFVPCWPCRGTGEIRVAEQQRIDADKAAHEATLPNYDAIAHAAVAAGEHPF
jgi:DnaJ-class molecular chaperone